MIWRRIYRAYCQSREKYRMDIDKMEANAKPVSQQVGSDIGKRLEKFEELLRNLENKLEQRQDAFLLEIDKRIGEVEQRQADEVKDLKKVIKKVKRESTRHDTFELARSVNSIVESFKPFRSEWVPGDGSFTGSEPERESRYDR